MRLASIVEGHGEIEALPVLLRRLLPTLVPHRHVEVPRPFRLPRGRIVHRPEELERALRLCSLKGDATLVLLDSDEDPACTLGPRLLGEAVARSRTPVGVVLAEREFESWFLAAAPSLAGPLGLAELEAPADLEAVGDAKGWLSARLPGRETYKEVLHQPRLAAAIDLDLARASSGSFDKLCREITRLCL